MFQVAFLFVLTVFVVYSFVICLFGATVSALRAFCPAHFLTYWYIVRYLWVNIWWWWWWWWSTVIDVCTSAFYWRNIAVSLSKQQHNPLFAVRQMTASIR